MNRIRNLLLVCALALAAGACENSSFEQDVDDDSMPTSYEFESRFSPGQSSVSYSGQLFRHVLSRRVVDDQLECVVGVRHSEHPGDAAVALDHRDRDTSPILPGRR